jgi:DNA invertase Pin-like site-specific DNA recombinase
MTTLRAAILVRLSQADPRAAAQEVDSVHVQRHDARHEFVDDGISGAECLKRPGLTDCRAKAEQRAFDILVVRDIARLSRAEAARSVSLLVDLHNGGVRVWSWAHRRFEELSGSGFILTAVGAMQAEEYRIAIGRDVRRALRSRAAKGFAVTHSCFGYRLVRDAKTDTPTWEIDADEAAVVVHIGETFVACGGSLRATAVRLNDDGARSPRGSTWRAQSIANILRQPLYRGELQWGRQRAVYERGTRRRVAAPADEVLKVPHPELKIWPDALLARIDELLALASGRGRPGGAARPAHLGAGFVTCSRCGHGLTVHGARCPKYACSWHASRGASACAGIGYSDEAAVDAALIECVAPLVDGDIAARALAQLEARLAARARPGATEATRDRLRRALAEADRRGENLARAIAEGQPMAPLLDAMRKETQRAEALRGELARVETAAPIALDTRRVVATARKELRDLAALRHKRGVEARPLLAAVLGGRRFEALPVLVDGRRTWLGMRRVRRGALRVGDEESRSDARLPSDMIGDPKGDATDVVDEGAERSQRTELEGEVAPVVVAAAAAHLLEIVGAQRPIASEVLVGRIRREPREHADPR